MKRLVWIGSVFALLVSASACDKGPTSSGERGVTGTTPPTGPAGATPAPAAAPEPILPLDARPAASPEDQRRVALGRRLYHDNLLSADGTVSCATCHNVSAGGAEPRKVSTGIRGQQGGVNAPTVLNAVHNFVQFWDGRAQDLRAQAEGPVENPIEMGDKWENVATKVAKDAWYKKEFDDLYAGKIDKQTITEAIAAYEGILVTPSRFDAFLRGNKTAITAEEAAGYAKFKEVGCPTCHTGVLAGGNSYQKLGLVKDYFADRGTPITEEDHGRFKVTKKEEDKHFFKVPTLRNVALTAPYLHDGTHETLEATVKTMAKYQLARELSDADATSIATFLRSLTGDLPEGAVLPDGELPKARLSPEPPKPKG